MRLSITGVVECERESYKAAVDKFLAAECLYKRTARQAYGGAVSATVASHYTQHALRGRRQH
jgi:hypothetical protein